jgi:hypothetical protein
MTILLHFVYYAQLFKPLRDRYVKPDVTGVPEKYILLFLWFALYRS